MGFVEVPANGCTVPPMKIRKAKSVFTRPGTEGDFAWMIEQPKYARSLFIFNDNETQFKAFHANQPNGLSAGGGNAIIRPFQAGAHPRAAGIPTGHAGVGYQNLDAHVMGVIDEALDYIMGLLESGRYDEIVLCTDPTGQTLGSGIFDIDHAVKNHIFQRLMEI
jgi:hypothetical protein